MSFRDLAAPYIAMGIRVFPLMPKSKVPPDWMLKFPALAAVDPKQIDEWNSKLPDANLALLAKAEQVGDPCFLEFDVPKGMSAACREMGQEFPRTRIHISGRKFAHIVFTHTERSLAMGNRNANLAGGKEWFSFRANNRYVLGPGSIHPDTGNVYGVKADVMPIPIPDWVCDWIERYTVSERKIMGDLPPVSEEFDFDAFAESLPFSLIQDGDWFIASFCPGVGRKHKHSHKTGIFFDGNVLGWKCFAQGCPCAYDEHGSKVTIGGMLRFLRDEFEWEYEGVIWDKATTERMLEDFGAEIVDLDAAEKAIFGEEAALESKTGSSPVQVESAPFPVITDGGVCTNPECRRYRAEASKLCARGECWPLEPTVEIPTHIADAPAPESAETAEPKPETKEFVLSEGTNGKGDILRMHAVLASDIEPEILEWVWKDKIPAGKIVLFAGQPDCGKTIALLDIVARVTRGDRFPDGSENAMGARRVLLAATEDDLNTTLVPRLMAAGADMSKVVIHKRVEIERAKGAKKERRMLQLAQDSKLLRYTLKKNPDIALVALDPISSYFGDADPNKDKEIRPVMEAVADACSASGAAVLAIIHNNKRGDTDAIGKILGASSVVGVSRAVWGFAHDPEDREKKYMTLVKGNLARNRKGMKYRVVDALLTIQGEQTILPKIEWLEETDKSSNDVLEMQREGGKEKKIDGVKLLLQQQLDESSKHAIRLRDFYDLCEREGLGEGDKIKKTVQRAVKQIGATTMHPPNKPKGPWWVAMDSESEPWVDDYLASGRDALGSEQPRVSMDEAL